MDNEEEHQYTPQQEAILKAIEAGCQTPEQVAMATAAMKRDFKFGLGNHAPYDEYHDPLSAYQMSQSIYYPQAQYGRWAVFLYDAAETGEYKYLMSPEEMKVYESLPDAVTVYRGIRTNDPIDDYGVSWTMSLDIAEWFAEHRGEEEGEPVVLTMTVPKERIVWVLLGRDEEEVVIAPDSLAL